MYPEISKEIQLDFNSINEWYKQEYQKLADICSNGDIFLLRVYGKAQLSYLAEYHRALLCFVSFGLEGLKKCSIVPNVLFDVLTDNCLTESSLSKEDSVFFRKQNRKKKYAIVTEYCKQNFGQTIKVQQIADIVEWSYPTANNFIKSRIDLFAKQSRGVYIMRNPDIERSKEKVARDKSKQ